MRDRTSQLIKLFFSNKKILLPGIFLVVFLALVPFAIAHAGLVTTIGNAIADSVFFVFQKMLSLVETILQIFFNLIAKAFIEISKWVLGFGVTPGADHTPAFVTTAWNAVRQITNIFFILI